jgi:hypothetical protein
MPATTATSPTNKVMVHWLQKLESRRQKRTGILDTRAMSGAAPEEDKDTLKIQANY